MSEVFVSEHLPQDTTKIIIDGLKTALVSELTESVIRDLKPVFGFGDSLPSAYSEGEKLYKLTMLRCPGSDFVYVPSDRSFTLTLDSDAVLTVYSACRCTQIERIHRAGEPMTERLTVIALGKEES